MLNEHLTDYEANAGSLQNHVAQKPVGFTKVVPLWKTLYVLEKHPVLKLQLVRNLPQSLISYSFIWEYISVWIGWLEGLHPYLVCIRGSFLKSTMLTPLVFSVLPSHQWSFSSVCEVKLYSSSCKTFLQWRKLYLGWRKQIVRIDM